MGRKTRHMKAAFQQQEMLQLAKAFFCEQTSFSQTEQLYLNRSSFLTLSQVEVFHTNYS